MDAHLIILGIFLTVLPHTLIVKSLLSLKAKTVSIIAALQPVYAIIFAYFIFSEIPRLRNLIGGLLVISASVTGSPKIIYGNVTNHGLIDNLPSDCCVEVPCLVDKNGIQSKKIGALPKHLAALIRTNINVQELTVEAVLIQKKEKIYLAAMLDPHTVAGLDLNQVWNLVDDLIEAHGEWLPTFL